MVDENTNGVQAPFPSSDCTEFKRCWKRFSNQEDKNYITDTIGKENIKYLESPFGMTFMPKMSIDGHEVDFSQALPSFLCSL